MRLCACGPELASGSLWQVVGQSCRLFPPLCVIVFVNMCVLLKTRGSAVQPHEGADVYGITRGQCAPEISGQVTHSILE